MALILLILKFLLIIVPMLLSVAFLTLVERKIMAAIQIRRGPNIIGYGFFQPLADGLKLLIKELIIPLKANKLLFMAAPLLFLTVSLAAWSVIPFNAYAVSSSNLSLLCFLALSSISVYGLLLGGWSSNSRYSFLGAVRSSSQMISYELVLGLLILFAIIASSSYNLFDITLAQHRLSNVFFLIPAFLIFLVAILAETNRTPFDLTEAEAELVAGYSVEYSSAPFAFYFIAEYGNLILWSHLTSILFFGGWNNILLPFFPPLFSFILKSFSILVFFIWIRATLPRYRFDQLLYIAWRFYLPVVLALIFLFSISYRFLI
jgi:NADH-quinone oxidoreductase subunit H